MRWLASQRCGQLTSRNPHATSHRGQQVLEASGADAKVNFVHNFCQTLSGDHAKHARAHASPHHQLQCHSPSACCSVTAGSLLYQ